MGMLEVVAKAFLSYAHADDQRERGRIRRLADHIREEFETLTGTTIEIFVDSAEILWGQDFRSKLDDALQATTFFIPVLTPTYFLRDECRKEMQKFVSSAESLGLQQLLLSIRYTSVPDLVEGSTDELKDIAARMQFEPWEGLRLLDEDSSEYRSAVHRLAARLVQLTTDLENPPQSDGSGGPVDLLPGGPPVSTVVERDLDEDEPGVIDLVQDLEPALTDWAETVGAIGPAIEEFNGKLNSASEKMTAANSGPNSFAVKIRISRELAADAEPTLVKIEILSKDYSSGVLRLDLGLRALFELIHSSEDDVSEFLGSIQGLVDMSNQSMVQIDQAAEAARANSNLSRDLRPVLRRFATAMRNIVDAQSLIAAWQSLLDSVAKPPLDLV